MENCLCVEEALGVGTHGAILLSSDYGKFVHSLVKYEMHNLPKHVLHYVQVCGDVFKKLREKIIQKPRVPENPISNGLR